MSTKTSWLCIAFLVHCSGASEGPKSTTGLGDPSCFDPVAGRCSDGCSELTATPLDSPGCFSSSRSKVVGCLRLPYDPFGTVHEGCGVLLSDGRIYDLSSQEGVRNTAWRSCRDSELRAYEDARKVSC